MIGFALFREKRRTPRSYHLHRTRVGPAHPAGRIISVTQVGDAASVQLSFDSATGKSHEWIDFHNLLRINGVWKITNKTATHSSG